MADFNLKDLQKVELEILLEIDRICKKNNIRYVLACGTLLGAIRHKGFIPWDDDIDICMPMSDYRRFCRIAKKELNDKYFLQNFKTDKTSIWFAKVRKNNTTAIEANHETKMHHQGVWVDIFPLIGIKNDKKWVKSFNKKAKLARGIMSKKIGLMEDTENNALYIIANKLLSLSFCRTITGFIFDRIFKDIGRYTHCDYLWANSALKARYESALFDEICDVDFEGYSFPAPKKWHEYLTIEYGDYMTPPPPEKRNGGCHTLSIVDVHNDYSKYTNG